MKTEQQQDQENAERMMAENLERVEAGGCAPPILVTTPKRNEAVARYTLSVDREWARIERNDKDGGWVQYDDHASAIAALQGEVSRLRAIADAARVYFDGYCQDEASDEVDGNGRGRWTGCHAYQIRDALALKEALNLEPPTGG